MVVTSKTVVINIVWFFVLIFFQVLILNHINLGGFINPYFYVFFILLLPFETPKWLLLISSFFLGLGIDLFTYTPGLNASASVLTAFLRPFVITVISSGQESFTEESPTLRGQGLKWFLYYSVSLVVIHHTSLFFLEIFRFDEIFFTLFRAVLSSLFTLLLIFITEYLLFSGKK